MGRRGLMGLIMDECGENIDCSLHVGMIRRVSASGGSDHGSGSQRA